MRVSPPRWGSLAAVCALVLVVGLSGGATAALVVTGKQIKDNTVTGKDLKNNTVTTADVANGTLTLDDLAGSTVLGLQGAPGPAGPPGVAGGPGVTGHVVETLTQLVTENGGTGTVGVLCPAGMFAVGGGGGFQNSPSAAVALSAPAVEVGVGSVALATDGSRPRGWLVIGTNTSGQPQNLAAYAICANVS